MVETREPSRHRPRRLDDAGGPVDIPAGALLHAARAAGWGLLETDRDGRIRSVTELVPRLTGHPAEELVGTALYQLRRAPEGGELALYGDLDRARPAPPGDLERGGTRGPGGAGIAVPLGLEPGDPASQGGPNGQNGNDVAHALTEAAVHGVHRAEGWQARRDGSWFWAGWIILAHHDDPGPAQPAAHRDPARSGQPSPEPSFRASGFTVVLQDLTAARSHRTQLRAVNEIGDAIRDGLSRDGVLNLVARSARELLGATACTVLTLEGGEENLLVRAVDGTPVRQLSGARVGLYDTAEGDVARTQRPLTVPDPPGGRRWRGSPLATTGARSAVLVPVPGRGRSCGVIAVADERLRRFTAQDARTVGLLAAQVGMEVAQDRAYVDNAHVWATARDKVASEERHRLAHELHDSVSQALYSIGLGARTARQLLDHAPESAYEPIDYILQLTEAGLAEMRALIFELRPHALAEEGLVAALTKQAAALRTRYDVATHVLLGPEPVVPLDVKLALYRVAQEALQNVARHARAGNVTVELTEDRTDVVLQITDDGVGFDPRRRFPGHLGLASMRKRIADVGGGIDIASAPGAGTRIQARAPRRTP